MTSDHILREQPEGYPLLDNDGLPISEIDVDNVDDAYADHTVSLQQLAAGARAWRFGHVIVDEAQDLTPMQWRMITRRARGGSMTIVGDLAQRSIGEPGEWVDHLPESIKDFNYRELTINYRSPAEIVPLASAILAELAPKLRVATSIRSVGREPVAVQVVDIDNHDGANELRELICAQASAIDLGRVGVIGASDSARFEHERVQWLDPWHAKGLEFDSVVVVEPARILAKPGGLSLLFVAVTRTTDRLTIVHQQPLPAVLAATVQS
ncbi:MAG: UvrD-helicase domain-containing protein [Acidimicrobiales bacterium]